MTAMGAHERHGAGLNVWLTPPELIQALGPFDLDPCFGEPRPWSTAKTHYGPSQDGLRQPWFGRVWCNPPYDHHAERWLLRCADHGAALALVFARTETAWFRDAVWARADAVFFFEKRLHFHKPDGSRAPANSGAPSVIVAYGAAEADRLQKSGLSGVVVRDWTRAEGVFG